MRGRVLGHYRVLDLVGAGGMGEVYRARDERLDRDVAIKVLPDAVAADPDRLARFEREAKALARIEHPNILTIHDFGHEASASGAGHAVCFAVTELLTGETLRSRLARERLSWRRAIDIGAAVADGLAAAHGQGIVHRDLKPDNIFLTADGRTKILDFGLAASGLLRDGTAPTEMPAGAPSAPGTVLGTVGYMAPEQIQGGTVDPRSDIFALGCVLYELVTGRRAFSRPTATETLAAILSSPAPDVSMSGTDAPPDLARIVSRCLEKQAGQRFQSASDLAFALRALTTSPVGAATGPTTRSGAISDGGAAASMLDGVETPARVPPRHSARRAWLIGGIGAVAVVALAAAAFLWLWPRAAGKAPTAASHLDAEKIVIAVFDNRTGDATLDNLGLLISETIQQGLTRIAGAKVALNPFVPSMTSAGLPRSLIAPDESPVSALAGRTGAGLVVTGTYYLDGVNLRIQAQLVGAASGALLTSFEPESGERSAPSLVVERLATRVMGRIAMRTNRGLASFAADVRPPRYEAYSEFALAMKVFGTNSSEAARHFKKALEVDPEFVFTRVALCITLHNRGQFVEADEALRPAEDTGAFSRATPIEQAWIRHARGILQGARQAAETAAGIVAAMQGQDPLGWYQLGLSERRVHRPRAAIEALAHAHVSQLPAEAGSSYSWPLAQLAGTRHELGEYEAQLELARTGYQHYPNDGAFYSQEVGALVALGRLGAVDEVVGRCEKASLRSGSMGEVLYHAARELSAHGYADEATAMARRAAAWYKNRMESGKPTPAERRTYAAMLARTGECGEAMRIRKELLREAPDSLAAQGSYAVAVATCGGSRAEARKIADGLAKVDRPFVKGAHHYERARVLAALGDRDGAMRALQAAYAQGAGWDGTGMHLDSGFDSLRDYPPFIELMKPKG